jgi:hypothetical protein
MSPIRRDEKKGFPFLSEETGDVVACIQPNLSSGEAVWVEGNRRSRSLDEAKRILCLLRPALVQE